MYVTGLQIGTLDVQSIPCVDVEKQCYGSKSRINCVVPIQDKDNYVGLVDRRFQNVAYYV